RLSCVDRRRRQQCADDAARTHGTHPSAAHRPGDARQEWPRPRARGATTEPTPPGADDVRLPRSLDHLGVADSAIGIPAETVRTRRPRAARPPDARRSLLILIACDRALSRTDLLSDGRNHGNAVPARPGSPDPGRVAIYGGAAR